MVRVFLAFVCAMGAVVVVSCGHQVSPNPAEIDLSGFVTVKFQTSGPLDFNNVDYVIAIDTCGTGVPYPDAFEGGLGSYSFAFLVGGGTANTAQPVLEQYYLNSSSSGFIKLPADNLTSSDAQFNPDLNGAGSEFSLTFSRNDLNNPLQIPAPCPHSTARTAGIHPGSTGVDVPPYLTTWTFNLMTFPAGSAPTSAYDSLGTGGPNDNTFSGIVVDVTKTKTYAVPRAPTSLAPTIGSEDIVYGEVDTYR